MLHIVCSKTKSLLC